MHLLNLLTQKLYNKKKTGELLELDAEFILRGINFYNSTPSAYLKAKFTYRKENGDWKLITGNELVFWKSSSYRKL